MGSNEPTNFRQNEVSNTDKVDRLGKEIDAVENGLKESVEQLRQLSSFARPLAASSPISRSQLEIANLKSLMSQEESLGSSSKSEPSAIRKESVKQTSDSSSGSEKSGILKRTKNDFSEKVSLDAAKDVAVPKAAEKRISDTSSKLIKDFYKLTEEPKMVQFDISHSEESYSAASPVKDSSWIDSSCRSQEQLSSLSTNESMPWVSMGPPQQSHHSPSDTTRRLYWDSSADIGLNMNKEKMRVVNQASREDLMHGRIKSDHLELEKSKRPVMKDTGTDPDDNDLPPLQDSSNSNAQTAQELATSIQSDLQTESQSKTIPTSNLDQKPKKKERKTKSLTLGGSKKDNIEMLIHVRDPFKAEDSAQVCGAASASECTLEMKDQSTLVNTLDENFQVYISAPSEKSHDARKASKITKFEEKIPELSARTQKIREILKIAKSFEQEDEKERQVDGITINSTMRQVEINVAGGHTNNSRTLQERQVQTSSREVRERGVQSENITRSKNVQTSGELSSLPKHFDTQKVEMTGQEVRTKSTQVFGGSTGSLPLALTNKERTKKQDVQRDLAAGQTSEQEEQNKVETSIKKETKRRQKLTVKILKKRDQPVDRNILQEKYFSQMVSKSTSMEVPPRIMISASTSMEQQDGVEESDCITSKLHKQMISIGTQCSAEDGIVHQMNTDEETGNDKAVYELWTDTLDSQDSSTQTAHSWVRGAAGSVPEPGVLRSTDSFEYLYGEEYERSGYIRVGTGSDALQDGVTESSSSGDSPPPCETEGNTQKSSSSKSSSLDTNHKKPVRFGTNTKNRPSGDSQSQSSERSKCSAGVQTDYILERMPHRRTSDVIKLLRDIQNMLLSHGIQVAQAQSLDRKSFTSKCGRVSRQAQSSLDSFRTSPKVTPDFKARATSTPVEIPFIDTGSRHVNGSHEHSVMSVGNSASVSAPVSSNDHDVDETDYPSIRANRPKVEIPDKRKDQGTSMSDLDVAQDASIQVGSTLQHCRSCQSQHVRQSTQLSPAIGLKKIPCKCSQTSSKSFSSGEQARTWSYCNNTPRSCSTTHLKPTLDMEVVMCKKCKKKSCGCVEAKGAKDKQEKLCADCKKNPCLCTDAPLKFYPIEKSKKTCNNCDKTACLCHTKTREVCDDCKEIECACDLNLTDASSCKESCKVCKKTPCTCLNSQRSQSLTNKKSCTYCNKSSCTCLPLPTERSSKKHLKTINGEIFGTYLDVDISSSEVLSSSSSGANRKQSRTFVANKEDACSVCHCSTPGRQLCVFCVCHIDKKTCIPRCNCHSSMPRYVIPGFCKCHQRNLRNFDSCQCSQEINTPVSKCPCCKFFAERMRAKLLQSLEQKSPAEKRPQPQLITPKNYFLKLEETEVSKDSTETSEAERRSLEVVTIKIPVKRAGKAKVPCRQFYYDGEVKRSSSDKANEIEFLDDIVNKYSKVLSSRRSSQPSEDCSKKRTDNDSAWSTNSYRTLQECLESNRPDFLCSAEYRRQLIQQRSRERQHRQLSYPIKPLPLPLAGERIFTTAELRQQARKKYRQLAEVTHKKLENKKRDKYRTNKIMAEIFARRLQLKTLRGQLNISNSCNLLAM